MDNTIRHLRFKVDEIPFHEISDPELLCKAPLVSIMMITYNHEPYITQAIAGVLKQKTEFPYELVIGEDCSTDGTRELIMTYQRKYPSIIRVITSDQNVGSFNNATRTSHACRGKYIAMCEGDDYWHDNYKLEMQIEYLESRPDYGLVHCDHDVLNQATRKVRKNIKEPFLLGISSDNYYECLLVNNFISSLTVLVRKGVFLEAIHSLEMDKKSWLMGDYPVWLELSKKAKCGYINKSVATYRILEKSASHSPEMLDNINFINSTHDIALYFVNKYGCKEETLKSIHKKYYYGLLNYGIYLINRNEAHAAIENLRKYGIPLDLRGRLYCFASRNNVLWISTRYLIIIKRHLCNKT
jgi:glycosyltransferase involved in cell wall biosynthesis